MVGKLPFIRESTPPPDIDEGQIVKAEIRNLEAPVKGNYGEQVEFTLALADSGFEAKAWMSYYKEPSERSKLGRLLTKLAETTGTVYQTVEEGLQALKQHGCIYLRCSGFRQWEGLVLPKFTIVADKLPPKADVKTDKVAKTLGQAPLQPSKESAMTRGEALDRSKNWPEEDRKAWLDYLKAQGKLKD